MSKKPMPKIPRQPSSIPSSRRSASTARANSISPRTRPSAKGGLDKEEGEEIIEANRKRLERFPGEALRPGPLVAAADLPGHGCRRQGLRDQERVRRRQPAGLRGHLVQAAVDPRARSRFHVAQHDRAARARPHRHLQPLLLRGVPGRARASARCWPSRRSPQSWSTKNIWRERYRGHLRDRALSDASGHRDPEILPQRLAAKSSASASSTGWSSRRRTGSSRWPTSPSASCGRATRRPIRT